MKDQICTNAGLVSDLEFLDIKALVSEVFAASCPLVSYCCKRAKAIFRGLFPFQHE